MNTIQQSVAARETLKKGFASKLLSFLMYGGFILIIAGGLAITILLDLYVF